MLTIKVKTEVEETKELQVPSFCRDYTETSYVGILDEKTVVSFFSMKNYCTIISGTPKEMEHKLKYFGEFQSCSEEEFMAAYDEVFHSLTLHPKLAV